MGRPSRPRLRARAPHHLLRYNMEISLLEAFVGKAAQIRIPTSVTCEACSGSGAKPGTEPKACSLCGGQGKVRHAQGFFTLERTCPNCHGRGQVHRESRANPARAPVASCASGRLSVNIPAGRGGRHPHPSCRRRRSGRARRAARATFTSSSRSAAHPFFQREGADLRCRVPVSLVTATLGGEFRGADNRRRQDKSEGARKACKPTAASASRRKGNAGAAFPGRSGDMYVQVVVETPRKI